MARLTTGQKALRLVDFMMGLRHRSVRSALQRHGFTESDRIEGYRLLKALTDDKLGVIAPVADPSLLDRLDAFENLWYPIADASLKVRFPEAHEYLFRNLRQTEGPELVIAVGTFVTRYEALPSAVPNGEAARELLEKRGLTDDVVEVARAALRELQIDLTDAPEEGVTAEEMVAREEAMWNWYLEWSKIAQTAIKDKRQLRALGFRRTKRGDATGVDDAEELEEEDDSLLAGVDADDSDGSSVED